MPLFYLRNKMKDEFILKTLQWYKEEVMALKDAMEHGRYDVGNACVAVLSLDNGARAQKAIKIIEETKDD